VFADDFLNVFFKNKVQSSSYYMNDDDKL